MSFGGGPSRKDLLDTIESQKKQLVQYQTRFKDVVQAYKSLLKEKEALEASLKVLTVTQEVDLAQQSQDTKPACELPEDGYSQHSEDSVDTAASVDLPCEAGKGDQSEEEQAEAGGKPASTVCSQSSLIKFPQNKVNTSAFIFQNDHKANHMQPNT